MRIAELAGRKVAVWGLGREGRAALAALRARVPDLVPTLFCSEAEARLLRTEEASRLKPLPPKPSEASRLKPTLPGNGLPGRSGFSRDGVVGDGGSGFSRDGVVGDGGSGFSRDALHIDTVPPDGAALSAFDLVIKSPGISAYRAEILEARHNGTHFTSGTALWFAEHPHSRVIAVTGTKGKSTVSALIAHLLRSLGRRVALAGNIGLPLLELLDPPYEPDWWVIELSSFQTRDAGAVEVGVVNNLYEEHLDWHGSRERYADDKLALADASRTLVVNALQPELQAQLAAHARPFPFGMHDGWHVADGAVVRGPVRVFDLDGSPLTGLHNAMNACAALAAIEAAGEDAIVAAAAMGSFRSLPHRLQVLGERDGRVFVDDSIATTPQATLEALASFSDRPVTVLVGGYDRGLDWRPFVQAMHETPPHAIVTMGANGERIRASLHSAGGNYQLESVPTLADAMPLAIATTPIGGVILLSPGAPSFDQFNDYVERGCAFARMAGFDPATIGTIDGLGIG